MSFAATEMGSEARARQQGWRANLVIAAAVLFVVLTTAAMAVFPGGATFDIAARHYLFLGNYLSDLGATHTYSGRSNTGARVLFTIALATVGCGLASFGPAWRAWARPGRGRVLGAGATACAALAGAFFVATAFTPWDRDYDTHTTLVRAAFGLVFAFTACLAAIQIRNGAPQVWTGINIAYLMALAGYIGLVLWGPSLFTRSGLETQVAAQKGIVYATVANLGTQAWAVRTATRQPARVRSTRPFPT